VSTGGCFGERLSVDWRMFRIAFGCRRADVLTSVWMTIDCNILRLRRGHSALPVNPVN
jgi:hypothetical protein